MQTETIRHIHDSSQVKQIKSKHKERESVN